MYIKTGETIWISDSATTTPRETPPSPHTHTPLLTQLQKWDVNSKNRDELYIFITYMKVPPNPLEG